MAVLTCTLHDNVGVVGKLVDALSELNVNIVTQESSALNYQNDHIVGMVLDWPTCGTLPKQPTRAS